MNVGRANSSPFFNSSKSNEVARLKKDGDTMIDTEIRLSGEAANEFHNMMISADLNSIGVRDKFISNLASEIDHQGALLIDISDLNVDLSNLKETGMRELNDL